MDNGFFFTMQRTYHVTNYREYIVLVPKIVFDNFFSEKQKRYYVQNYPTVIFDGVILDMRNFPKYEESFENWNFGSGRIFRHFYRLHYPHIIFHEIFILIGDIMHFIEKCPGLPHPPYTFMATKDCLLSMFS